MSHWQTRREAWADHGPEHERAVDEAGSALAAAVAGGGTVFACGNGGSAAQADHLVAELVGRYVGERPALPAVALPGGAATATALANDYGYGRVFARALEGLAKRGDALVALSTSGSSPNIIAALETAERMGLLTIFLTGSGGGAAEADHLLAAPSDDTPTVQEIHLCWIHRLCELAER